MYEAFAPCQKTRQANHVASPANASGATMCASATTCFYFTRMFLGHVRILLWYATGNGMVFFRQSSVDSRFQTFLKTHRDCVPGGHDFDQPIQ